MKTLIAVTLYHPLFNLLIFFAWLFAGNVAAAIIILTVLVRAALIPSSLKALQAQRKMRLLQPELERIRAEHKGDPKAQNEAMLSFYREHKVSPFSSCLPLLLQFPILIVLYYVFRAGLDTSHYGVLYHFTPRPEHLSTNFFGINLGKPDLWILPILAGAAQFVQSRQISALSGPSPKKDGNQPDMQRMLNTQMIYIFPLFTVLVARSLPAALPLYWLITTLFMIVQQAIVLKKPDAGLVNVTVRRKSNG